MNENQDHFYGWLWGLSREVPLFGTSGTARGGDGWTWIVTDFKTERACKKAGFFWPLFFLKEKWPKEKK
jgi:hypothetical protein